MGVITFNSLLVNFITHLFLAFHQVGHILDVQQETVLKCPLILFVLVCSCDFKLKVQHAVVYLLPHQLSILV